MISDAIDEIKVNCCHVAFHCHLTLLNTTIQQYFWTEPCYLHWFYAGGLLANLAVVRKAPILQSFGRGAHLLFVGPWHSIRENEFAPDQSVVLLLSSCTSGLHSISGTEEFCVTADDAEPTCVSVLSIHSFSLITYALVNINCRPKWILFTTSYHIMYMQLNVSDMFCSVYPRVQYMSTACISRDPGNINHVLIRP